MAKLRGQKVSSAFWSGFSVPKSFGVFKGTMITSVTSGIVSRLTGGKFANGAVTGAFVHLFNTWGGDPIMKRALGDPDDKFDFYKDTSVGRVISGIGETFYKIGTGLSKSLSSLETNIHQVYKNNPLGENMANMLFLKSQANGESKLLEASDIYNGVDIIENELNQNRDKK